MGEGGTCASSSRVGCCKDVPVELSESRGLSRIISRVMTKSDVFTKGPTGCYEEKGKCGQGWEPGGLLCSCPGEKPWWLTAK